MLADTPCSTYGVLWRYLSFRSRISMAPRDGQPGGGVTASGGVSTSVASELYSRTRSTLTACTSQSLIMRVSQFSVCVTARAVEMDSPASAGNAALELSRPTTANSALEVTMRAPSVSRRTASHRLADVLLK